ncbi:hypothetical protein Tco_1478379 [Tanacetum coccineum]
MELVANLRSSDGLLVNLGKHNKATHKPLLDEAEIISDKYIRGQTKEETPAEMMEQRMEWPSEKEQRRHACESLLEPDVVEPDAS